MTLATTDPRAMTEAQRRREIVAILAAGLSRTPPAGQLPPDRPAENPAEPAPTCLEVPGGTRLSVTAG